MHNNYKIDNSTYLNPTKHYLDPETYPNFQRKFLEFKEELVSNSKENINNTYYKFGDGDYYLFKKNTEIGNLKPGRRDIKKNDFLAHNDEAFKEIKKGSQNCDKYLCEIKFMDLFKEVMGDKAIDYPAEYAYGIISSKWVFKNFNKIALIGSNKKLEIIKNLMEYSEYQEYLGIDKFEDYIGIPQVFGLSKRNSIYKKIRKKVEKSNAEIFLSGVGLLQNTLLSELKPHIKVPLVTVGVGIDAISGLVDVNRPYFGEWKNYQIKNLTIYKKINDTFMKTTNSKDVIKYLN